MRKREQPISMVEPEYLVKRLYTLGLLERKSYQVLEEAIRLRNQAARGFQADVTLEHLSKVSIVLRELVGEVELKAA